MRLRMTLEMADGYWLPLVLDSQSRGGYVVTCPVLPELVTEGDAVGEAIANARDAFAVVLEIYEDAGKPLPEGVGRPVASARIDRPASRQ